MTKVVKVQDGDYKLVVGSAPTTKGTILLDTNQGEVVIKGDLTVYGKQTSIDSESLEISDNIIQLNKGETGSGVTGLPGSEGKSGIEINRGTKPDVSLVWNESSTTSVNGSTTLGAFTLTNANGDFVPIKTNSIGVPSGNLSVDLSGSSALVISSVDSSFKYHENILDYTNLSTFYSIKSISRTNNVVTVALYQAHDIVKGMVIDIVCHGVAGVSGNLIQIASTPSSSTFTYSKSGPNIPLTPATGSVSINPIKNLNVIPNFRAVADYMSARDGVIQVSKITKDDTQVKVEDTALYDPASRIVFEVDGSVRSVINNDGLYVDNVKIHGNSITNFSSNSLLLDSTVGIVNTEDTPLPSTGYTSLYSRADVGEGGTSLYFVTTKGIRDELVSNENFKNKINSLLPTPPEFPGGQTLSIPAAVERRIASSFTQLDNTGNNATVQPGSTVLTVNSTVYQTNIISGVGPGTNGEVVAIKNKANAGSHTMTPDQDAVTYIGTDAGTYGDLIIANDQDYFLSGTFPFKNVRQTFDLKLSGSVPSGWNEIYAYTTASDTLPTNTVRWYADTSSIGKPSITNLTITEKTPGLVYSSTVPHYSTSTVLNVNFSVSKLSGETYPISDTFVTGTAGGAFNAPASVTYQQAGITTPLPKNLYVSSGSASITTPVTIKSGFGVSSTSFSVTASNGYGTATSTATLTGPVLYKTGTQNPIEETAIPINSVGKGSTAGLRIINPGVTDTPIINSTAAFNSQTSQLNNTDATVVASVLKHDVTDYRTYYPSGPNLNIAERTSSQYFTFKFVRTAVSKFDIKYSGTLAGLWVALPGSVIDTTSSLNGWLDSSILYEGSGTPGANTGITEVTEPITAINFFNSAGCAVALSSSPHYFFNTDAISPIATRTITTVSSETGNGSNGCAISNSAQLNTLQTNKRITVTFGTVSSSSTLTNEILVRIKLTPGQTITLLTIESASN